LRLVPSLNASLTPISLIELLLLAPIKVCPSRLSRWGQDFFRRGVDGELVLEFVPGNEEETFLLEYENWLPPTSTL
jgi:hypothetical protein